MDRLAGPVLHLAADAVDQLRPHAQEPFDNTGGDVLAVQHEKVAALLDEAYGIP